jgi:hypothetical protein
MTDEQNKSPSSKLLCSQFRVVADSVCRPGATKDSGATNKEKNDNLQKSYPRGRRTPPDLKLMPLLTNIAPPYLRCLPPPKLNAVTAQ